MARITIDTPDLSERGMTGAFREALDAGLRHHRTAYLPLHFRREAPQRYPVEYAAHVAAVARRAKRAKMRRSAADWKEYYQQRQELRRERWRQRDLQGGGRRSLDPDGTVPLVQTGRLRLTILSGSVSMVGAVRVRSMKFNAVPRYLFPYGPNQMNKVAALQALRQDEEEQFAAVVDRELDRYLKHNTQRRSE